MWQRIKQFKWWIASGGVAVLGFVAWQVPVARAQLRTISSALVGGGPPVTIVTDEGKTAELSERLGTLEAELVALKQARVGDADLIKKLQIDYQAAIAETAAAHDTFVKEAAQVEKTINIQATNTTTANTTTTSTKTSGKISLNHATLAQLDSLPGIGPSYAQRIIDYRTEHGGFKSINELEDIKGIGPATIEKIRDLVEL